MEIYRLSGEVFGDKYAYRFVGDGREAGLVYSRVEQKFASSGRSAGTAHAVVFFDPKKVKYESERRTSPEFVPDTVLYHYLRWQKPDGDIDGLENEVVRLKRGEAAFERRDRWSSDIAAGKSGLTKIQAARLAFECGGIFRIIDAKDGRGTREINAIIEDGPYFHDQITIYINKNGSVSVKNKSAYAREMQRRCRNAGCMRGLYSDVYMQDKTRSKEGLKNAVLAAAYALGGYTAELNHDDAVKILKTFCYLRDCASLMTEAAAAEHVAYSIKMYVQNHYAEIAAIYKDKSKNAEALRAAENFLNNGSRHTDIPVLSEYIEVADIPEELKNILKIAESIGKLGAKYNAPWKLAEIAFVSANISKKNKITADEMVALAMKVRERNIKKRKERAEAADVESANDVDLSEASADALQRRLYSSHRGPVWKTLVRNGYTQALSDDEVRYCLLYISGEREPYDTGSIINFRGNSHIKWAMDSVDDIAYDCALELE